MRRKRGPETRFTDEIPKAFDLYVTGEFKLHEIATAVDVKEGTVMYLIKADPRYKAWKAEQDALKTTKEEGNGPAN